MSVHRVSELLKEHVTLEVEGIDRMFLNAYVPGLQTPQGVAWFFRSHRGQTFASSALMEPMSKSFVAGIEAFVKSEQIPIITFQKGQRKDDIAKQMRVGFDQDEGVVFVGKAQEKAPVIRTESRTNPQTGQKYPWLVRSTGMVNQYYFYIEDSDFGPLFIKFCSYFPYTAKVCINGTPPPTGRLDIDMTFRFFRRSSRSRWCWIGRPRAASFSSKSFVRTSTSVDPIMCN